MDRKQDERSPFEKMKEMTNGEVRSQDSSVERWILIGAREAAKAY